MDYNEFRQLEYIRRDLRLQTAVPMKVRKKPHSALAPTQPLRIVYVMTWTGICGGSKIIFEHCNRLAARGHSVTILCHLPRPEWFPLDSRVAFIQPDFTEVLCEHIPECDVIVATYWKEIYECVEQGIAPVVYFEQGDLHLFAPETMGADIMGHVRKQLMTVPFVYTVSSYAAEALYDVFGVAASVIPNAVDGGVFYNDASGRSPNEKIVITTIGPDYVYFKSIPDIMEAVYRVRQKHDIEFIWITPSGSEAFANAQPLVNPPQQLIGDCLRRTDIYVCASLFESFCLPVLEAMTCGAAVVTTDCGGVRDYIIDGENALIINKHDIDDIEAKLTLLITDAGLRSRLSKAALRTAQRFSWEKTADKLEEYYREIARWEVVQ
jgi:glycosyltransferase involved in cell wall biosynthesis